MSVKTNLSSKFLLRAGHRTKTACDWFVRLEQSSPHEEFEFKKCGLPVKTYNIAFLLKNLNGTPVCSF